MIVVVLALRGIAAVLALTTLVGGIPRIVQLGLAVTVGLWSALLVLGSLRGGAALDANWAVALHEVAIGTALGIVGAMPLLAAAAAGRIVDVAASGRAQGGPYAVLFGVLSAVVFVGIDGHVAVMRAIVESHATLPAITTAQASVLATFAHLVPAAVRLAIPWLVTAAVVQISVGVGTRVAGRAGMFVPTAAAVPAALAMMTASLVATLAVVMSAMVRGSI